MGHALFRAPGVGPGQASLVCRILADLVSFFQKVGWGSVILRIRHDTLLLSRARGPRCCLAPSKRAPVLALTLARLPSCAIGRILRPPVQCRCPLGGYA